MKKVLLFAGVLALSASILSSCGGKDEKKDEEKKGGWSDGEKKAYMDACSARAAESLGADKAKEYCQCTLDKMEEKYPSAADVSKVSADEITKMAEECMGM